MEPIDYIERLSALRRLKIHYRNIYEIECLGPCSVHYSDDISILKVRELRVFQKLKKLDNGHETFT